MSDAPRTISDSGSRVNPRASTNMEFRALFRGYAPFVWRVLRRYGVPPADLEDVCQEVFIVVHRRLSEFEGRAELRTWIYEIARRSALAQRRRAARCDLLPGELELSSLAEDAPDRQVEKQRALAWLHWGLAQLDEEKREAFVLYEFEQLTLAEVAQAMGCSINAVHYRVLMARKELTLLSRRPAAQASAQLSQVVEARGAARRLNKEGP